MRVGKQECIVGDNLIHRTCRKRSPFRGDASDKLTPLTENHFGNHVSSRIHRNKYKIILTVFDFTNEITYAGQQSESHKLLGASHILL